MRARTIIAAVVALTAAPALAQWGQFESEFDEQKKPWTEIEARMPAYPRAENLIQFDGGGGSPHRFYIDTTSVSIGEDGVVRYAMVVRAAAGATNVTFEGMRCETGEQKLYAVGRSDGRWARARDPAWSRVERKQFNAYHAVLYHEFLCPNRVRMTTVNAIVDTLRRESAGIR